MHHTYYNKTFVPKGAKEAMISRSKRRIILSIVASTVLLFPAVTAVSAETVYKIKTGVKQGLIYGLDIKNGKIYVTEVDTGKVNQVVSTDAKTAADILPGDKNENSFAEPKGIAADTAGNLYVADSGNHVIKKITSSGEVTVLAGSGDAGYSDGPADKAQFNSPADVAIAADGSVYVADTLNHRIRKIAKNGEVTTVAGGSTEKDADGWLIGGYQDGKGTAALFNEPSSLAFDKQGNLYIADTGNQRIRMIKPDGTVSTVAGGGSEMVEGRYVKGGFQDGKAAEARFSSPLGLAVADNNIVYVADAWNNRIRAIYPEGLVTTVAGGDEHGSVDGWGIESSFDGPTDVAVAPDGMLLVADRWNRAIRMISPVLLPDKTGNEIHIMLNSQPLRLQTKPVLLNGSTLVPLREIAEALGYRVTYDASKRGVSLTKDGRKSEVASQDISNIGGKAMVTVRSIGKLLDLDVIWSPAYRLIDLIPQTKQQ